jgi:acetyltransferase-like isoleucine patch superfamily enzyme
MHGVEVTGEGNEIKVGRNARIKGKVDGNNNKVIIEDSASTEISIHIFGNNNSINVRHGSNIKALFISCGNHVSAHNTELKIDAKCSIEPGGKIYLYNSGNRCVIRCGESPHLIFDKITGRYLDISEGVFIGDHVWIGEQVYITKNVSIPSDCIVAACSVVTRRFEERHCVLGGNPARIVKQNVKWVRNHHLLESDSIYKREFDKYRSTK